MHSSLENAANFVNNHHICHTPPVSIELEPSYRVMSQKVTERKLMTLDPAHTEPTSVCRIHQVRITLTHSRMKYCRRGCQLFRAYKYLPLHQCTRTKQLIYKNTQLPHQRSSQCNK